MAAPAMAQQLPALYAVTGVAANDVLNIRAEPDARSPILSGLRPDATDVEITGISPDGRWGRVNVEEGIGWAALRFLTPQPGGDWQNPNQPLRCYGTEPFWSVGIEGTNARFQAMGETPQLLEIRNRSVPMNGWGRLGIDMSGGFAVLSSQECSDGMSDRQWALSINLFLRADGGLHGYAGCCSLE